MQIEPAYQVFVADDLGLVNNPVVITAVYLNHDNKPKGEWFLLFPDEHNWSLVTQETIIHYDPPIGPEPFTQAIFFEELLDQAQRNLRSHISATRKDVAKELLARRLGIAASNRNLLVNLWMNDVCADVLTVVGKKTSCPPLSEFLEWLVTLPKLKYRDL